MKFFPLYDFQLWVLAVVIGLISVIYLYVAFGGAHRRTGKGADEIDMEDEHLSIEDKTEDNPPAPILFLIYAGIALWCIGYIIMVGIMDQAIR